MDQGVEFTHRMAFSFYQKLKRLRAMTVAEILFRLRQSIDDKLEKQRVLTGRIEPVELFVSRLSGTGESLEDKFKNVFAAFQQRRFFVWQKEEPQKLAQEHKSRFPDTLDKTTAAAEKYLNHEFEVFGLHVHFENQINWHYDPLLIKSVPVNYWSDINYYSPDVVKEVKYIWELNRCQHFVTLAKAFFLTGDEKYARGLFHQWSEWIDKNPFKMGVNWTSSLECAFRLISWTRALAFVRNSGQLNPGLYVKILYSINFHAHFIADHLSKYSSANNHLIGEALGLIYAGTYFPELPESELWRNYGFKLFNKEIARQVHPDGVTTEQTTFYQKYIFDFGVLALVAAEKANVNLPTAVKNRLEKMAEFYATLIDENGNIPHIGDDDGGCAVKLTDHQENSNRELLSAAAVLFARSDFKHAAEKLSESTFWLLSDAARIFDGLESKKDGRAIHHFKNGGYVILNQHQPVEQKMVFDCGPLGLSPLAAHGHADALSITLSVDGQPVLIDSGTWLYLGAGDERNTFRSTRAHNTLTADEQNQSEIIGPFQWGRQAEVKNIKVENQSDHLFVEASHNGYRRNRVIHQRRIEVHDGMWIVKDFISGVGNHQIDVYFHCLASNLKQRERAVVIDYSTFTVEFQFEKLETIKDKLSIDKAWHSFHFGQRDQHSVIRRQVTGPLPLELSTKIRIYA